MGSGLAIPHATVPGLDEPVIGVALGREPIAFGPADTDPVRVFFVLLSPPGREREHVKLLARICRLMRHESFIERLEAAEDAESARPCHRSDRRPARMSAPEMRLLVAVIHDPEKLDEILSGFIELGITGATLVNSEGMGSVLSHDIPIFAGLQTLISSSRPQNRLLLSVIPVDKVKPAVDLLLQKRRPASTRRAPASSSRVPVDAVFGLAPELGGEQSPI